MTNEKIIADAAVSAGLYTEEEVSEMINSGKEIPLHTLSGWSSRGKYKIKAGEHGIETRLWKKKIVSSGEKGNSNKGFYLAKAYLFTESQIELREADECAV